MFENLVFGRSRLNSSVFEKHYISYLCILLIKKCALRSFCIRMCLFWVKIISGNAFPKMRLFGWSGKFYFPRLKSVDPKKQPLNTEMLLHFYFPFKAFPENEREKERARAREREEKIQARSRAPAPVRGAIAISRRRRDRDRDRAVIAI